MRKIDPKYENPLDNILIDLADKTSVYYKQLNMTPNHITTLSLIFGILSAYYLYNGMNTVAAILFMISYYFDCVDGYYARKYSMTSAFGDAYDHISDGLKYTIIIFVMYKLNSKKFIYTIAILALLFLLQAVHIGCQEKIYDTSALFMNYTRKFCPNPNNIVYTRWFGSGTCNLVFAILIYFY